LIKMSTTSPDDESEAALETYRVFSQLRECVSVDAEEEGLPQVDEGRGQEAEGRR